MFGKVPILFISTKALSTNGCSAIARKYALILFILTIQRKNYISDLTLFNFYLD
jgi:hypothetical protein